MADTWVGRTATDIAAAVRAGEAQPREVLEQHLRRVTDVDARLAAFQRLRVEAARAEADAVAERADLAALPLAGVPLAVKDNLAVAGEPSRDGSVATTSTPASNDHEVVRRLRDAGAVVLGLTRVPELCVFGATDSAFGVTRNPWDLDRSPGGSSGGTAAAVAAALVPVGVGNDGMGSIRIPSACCGLVGVKPGLGTVPAGIGANDWYAMAENGPLATTVGDAALVLSVLAGDERYAEVRPVGRPLRIAVSPRNPVQGLPVDPDWAAAAQRAGQILGDVGHTVTDAAPAYSTSAGVAGLARWVAGTAADADTVAHPQRLERRVRVHAALGRGVRRAGLVREAQRTRWRSALGRWFSSYDVLVTPALAQDPLPAVRWHRRGWFANVAANARYAPFTAPWNLAGYPAMTVPAGIGPRGLPLAVQLVAPDGGEALLLSVAAQLEAAQPWPRHPPAFTP